MKAVVVYESLWGNTAAIARAIAEGIGPEARALSTSEASPETVADTDLIVAGAPVLGFTLPTEDMRENLRKNPGKCPAPPDLEHPSMRAWLDTLPRGTGRGEAFETRIWWSPGGSTKSILQRLDKAGYRVHGNGARFIVTGRCGPLKAGELEKARRWGAEIAKDIG